MQKLSNRPAAAMSETICYFKNPVELTIDWTIPNFSSLRDKKTAVFSRRTFFGASAWSIQLDPLYFEDQDTLLSEAAAYVCHDYIGSPARDVTAQYKIR